MPAAHGRRSIRRTLVAVLVAALLTGVATVAAPVAARADSLSDGQLLITDPASPVTGLTQFVQNPGLWYQIATRDYGTAFYGRGGYTLAVNSANAVPGEYAVRSQSTGGSGTQASPYTLTTAATARIGSTDVYVLQRTDTYVVGQSQIRSDVTFTPLVPDWTRTGLRMYADCYFAGSDSGFSSASANGRAACHQSNAASSPQMSFISATPGASAEAGSYSVVNSHALRYAPLSDSCLSACYTGTGSGSSIDNGMALGWQVDTPVGTPVTVTFYTTYTDDLRFADLAPRVTASASALRVGDQTTLQLSVTNDGPDTAGDATAVFPIPAGLAYVTAAPQAGTSYDPATGVWTLGGLTRNQTRTMALTLRATAAGTFDAGFASASSDAIDQTPCAAAGEGCGTPVVLDIDPVPLSLADSTVSASPVAVVADGVSTTTVSVTLTDEDGAAITGGDHDVALRTTLGTLSSVSRASDGTYRATLSSTDVGTAVVGFSVDGQDAPDTAEVEFAPGAPSAAASSFAVSAGDRVADGAATHTVAVALKDALGHPVTGAAARLSAAAAPADGVTVGAFAETAGVYTAVVRSTTAGQKTISVRVDATALPVAGNAVASFVAGAVDPSQAGTSYDVSTGTRSVDGGAHTVTVRLADVYGNPVTGQAAAVSATSSDALGSGGIGAFAETAPGAYTASVTSTVAGGKAILARVDIAGASAAITADGNGVAVFTAGDVATGAGFSSFAVSSGVVSVEGGSHLVTVRLEDRFHNPVSGRSAQLSAEADGLGDGRVSAFAETSEPGTYTATVTSSLAGRKSVAVAYAATPLSAGADDVAEFGAGAVDLTSASTGFTVSDGDRVADGVATHTITVRLSDANGNVVGGRAGALSASAGSSLGGGVVGDFAETSPGTYEASVTSTVAGSIVLTARFGGSPLAARDDAISRFVAGPPDLSNARTGYLVSAGEASVDGGAHTLTATLYDAFDNPVPGQTLAAVSADPLGGGAITALTETAEPGVYTATITSTSIGRKRITVTRGADAVNAIGNAVATFRAAAIDTTAPGTRFHVSTGAMRTGGADVHTITVALTDRYGNPIPDGAAALRATAAGGLGDGAIGDFLGTAVPGTYTATVSSTAAGRKTIAVTVDGSGAAVSAEGNDVAVFADVPVVPAVAPSNGERVSGTAQPGMTVTVADDDGVVLCRTEADGTGAFSCPLAPAVADRATLSVAATDEESGFVSASTTVVVDAVAPATPSIRPSDGTSVAGCAEPGSVVTVTDRWGAVLGSVVAGSDCRYEVTFPVAQAEGGMVEVTVTDPAGNSSVDRLRFGLPSVELSAAVSRPGDTLLAIGRNFQPGESVSGVLHSTPVPLGTLTADANGEVVFSVVIPAGFEPGTHTIVLTGARSGSVSDASTVVADLPAAAPALAATGGGVPLLPVAGAVVLLLGGVLMVALRRRRAGAAR